MVLYTVGCPACRVLETKLKEKGVSYEVNTSEQAIKDLGYSTAPLLDVDGKILNFTEAIQYVNNI